GTGDDVGIDVADDADVGHPAGSRSRGSSINSSTRICGGNVATKRQASATSSGWSIRVRGASTSYAYHGVSPPPVLMMCTAKPRKMRSRERERPRPTAANFEAT